LSSLNLPTYVTLNLPTCVTYPTKNANVEPKGGDECEALLREESFDAYNLTGSILSWTHIGGELVSGGGPGGGATKRVHTFGKNWDLAATVG